MKLAKLCVSGWLAASVISSHVWADPIVTTVSGGNQAIVNAELTHMKVVAIRKAVPGSVFDVVDASAVGKKVTYSVWVCDPYASNNVGIPVNTLETAYKNKLSVNIDVQATFEKGQVILFCLTDARLNSTGFDALLNLAK